MEWTSVQLRSLVELARRGTITAVAQALGYTPGGVSQQLATLEKAAGQRLLRRVGRRVELTDAGRALATHAERMLGVEADAVAALERAGTAETVTGRLDVTLFATAAAEILPLVLTALRRRYPDLDVRSRETVEVDEVYDSVASGGMDLALGLDYPDMPIRRDPALRMTGLYRERFSVAVPPGTLAGAEVVSLSELAESDWILPDPRTHYGQAVLTVCRRAGVEPRVRHEVTDTAASLALVEAGVGIAPVTGLMLGLRPSRVDVVRLTDTFERDIVAITRAVAQTRPTVAALAGVLAELDLDDRANLDDDVYSGSELR